MRQSLIWLIMLSAVCALLPGCTAFSVHDDANNKKKGVPFYIKQGKVKQTTVYSRVWVDVTIDYQRLPSGEKIPGTERAFAFVLSSSSYDQVLLMATFNDPDVVDEDDFQVAMANLTKALNSDCRSSNKNCIIPQKVLDRETDPEHAIPCNLVETLEANGAVQVTVVDYTNTYYFNTAVPAFGTASATAELAADGTLTKATSSVDSSKLADLIPLKELLVDKLGLSPPLAELDSKLAAMIVPVHKTAISIGRDGYNYTLTKLHPPASTLNPDPLTFNSTEISVSRARFGKHVQGAASASENTISIEGAIVLPDAKE